MKIYKYLVANTINRGTEYEPDIVQTFVPKEIPCTEENYATAKAEAYNGEVTVEEVADPETPDTPTGDDSIWADMAAAIEEGVNDV